MSAGIADVPVRSLTVPASRSLRSGSRRFARDKGSLSYVSANIGKANTQNTHHELWFGAGANGDCVHGVAAKAWCFLLALGVAMGVDGELSVTRVHERLERVGGTYY